MHVVKVSDFLDMKGVLEPHHALLRKGLLHRWTPGMSVIFVSHQWLSSGHPDPQGRHAAVLRSTLQGVLDGSLQVEMDVAYDANVPLDDAVEYARNQVLSGYIFLDWFAIPQITARAEGVNEESTKSDAALAVQSIPFYVEASTIFLALVPEVKHKDTGRYCNYTSWLSRGWCRAELWCHLLSSKPFTQVIVVFSSKESQFMYPRDWQENTIDTGDFTVESDRDVVRRLGEVAVEHKIQNLSSAGPENLYRFFLARRSRMLGQPSLTRDMDDFLFHFKFPDLESAISAKSSMNGVQCATLSGDVKMLRCLAQKKADLNANVLGLEELGFSQDWSLLMVALESRQSAEMIRTLLDLGADVHASSFEGTPVPAFVKNSQHIEELLRSGADFHKPGMPLGLTPLAKAAGMSNAETVSALLRLRCDPNPPLCGLGVTPMISGVALARGNSSSVQIVHALLEGRADPNVVSRQSGMWLTMVAVGRAKVALLGRQTCTPQTRSAATLPGSTPLLTAAAIGSEELVELLLRYGAYPQPNDRGETCEFLAEANGHYNVLPSLRTFPV
ncbi:unnamed protein product [Symbiodinium natans]|uniref:Uncharacterized protein n=1 Tax=Symbiodinium natans TaxID=878477 RepID=A0A812TFF8_9DINO|nr:unnamed protein product [Symbiodinium natans]